MVNETTNQTIINNVIESSINSSEISILIYLIIAGLFFLLSKIKDFELIGSFSVFITGFISLINTTDQFILSSLIMIIGVLLIFKE